MKNKFSIKELSNVLQTLSYIEFAYLFGSSQDGEVSKNSDVDIAVYFSNNYSVGADMISEVIKKIEDVILFADIDLCRMNEAGEILNFEILRGKILFIRPESIENFQAFYSRVCREYEDTMYWMKKQLEYRGIYS